MYKHEDTRRSLIDLELPAKAVKILTAKKGCVVGDHWHNKKEEWFLLISGSGTVQLGSVVKDIQREKVYHAPKGLYHRFYLDEGSVMVGVASEPFDPKDEINT